MSRTINKLAILYPSGNTTAVVFDNLGTLNREKLNYSIIESWKSRNPGKSTIEQCCFVVKPKNQKSIARVEMFGGEFCGNAARSVVWLLTKGKDDSGIIEVSGASRPLNFSIKKDVVTIEMPLPSILRLVRVVPEGILVQLDGIAQLVVADNELRKKCGSRELLVEIISDNKYGLASQPAVGVTYFDSMSNKAQFSVWVKAVNTVFDETACGSGTCSIGVAAGFQTKRNQKVRVIQPSGEVIVAAVRLTKDGKIQSSTITGKVKTLYEGRLELI